MGKVEKSKPRLLVLDTIVYQKLFDAILGEDYQLLATEDPGEAITLAAAENPDLIMLSHSVGKADGIMVAKELRETLCSKAPILLLLTSDRPTLRREAQKAGCNGFLIKPIDPDRLKSQIEEWLQYKVD